MDTPNGFHKRSIAGQRNAVPLRRRRPYGQARRQGNFWRSIGGLVPTLGNRIASTKHRLGWKQLLLRVGVGLVGVGIVYLAFLWLTLPNIRDPSTFRADQSTIITDRNGIELYRLFDGQDRTVIGADQIPLAMKHAMIAIEDQRFYQHGCVDPKGILRAAFSQFLPGFVRSGASTLEQQLARNSLLTNQRTVTRKLREVMLACELESTYNKDQILALYLNWVPFGPNIYGVEQASKRYFAKSAKDISIAQAAILASIPQNPPYYNPYGKHVRTQVTDYILGRIASGKITQRSQIADKYIATGLLGNTFGTGATAIYIGGRADQVLKNMQDQGYIKETERQQALAELAALQFKPDRESIRAPHFTEWIKQQLQTMYEKSDASISGQGFTIQTSLDWRLQEAAENIIASKRDAIGRLYNARNISLVAMDPKTREILAYVGNANYDDQDHGGKIDMVQSPRQAGSSFKPLIYADAFTKGYGPATVLFDVRTKFGPDEPHNFDGGYWGLISARRALAGSRNIPAIKAYFLAGNGQEDPVLDFVASLGAKTPKLAKAALDQKSPGVNHDYGYTMALGAAELPLLEMANAYSTLADAGKYKDPISILKITDQHKAIREESNVADEGTQVLDARVAYEVTSILSDVGARPGAFWQSALTVPGMQAAAKTGTSDVPACNDKTQAKCQKLLPHDLLTIGYTPDLVVAVWAGNADNSLLPTTADGLNVAAPIWKEFMIEAQKIRPETQKSFPMPGDIIVPQISMLSGQLPTDCTPVNLRISDIFLKENAPTLADPACQKIVVDKVTGLLPSDSCPSDATEERPFLVAHSVLPDRWPDWEQGVQNWAANFKNASGSLLAPAPTEKCDITKTPGRLVQPQLKILFPQDGGTANFPVFTPSLDFKVGSGVTSIVYNLDGKDLSTVTAAPFDSPLRMAHNLDQTISHTLKVTLTDTYFNQTSDQVTFRFQSDTIAPKVQMMTPFDGTTVKRNQTLHIQAQATDDSGIKYVEFYLDSLLLSRNAKAPFEFDYSMNGVSVGDHVLKAVATDFGNNTAEAEVTVTVSE